MTGPDTFSRARWDILRAVAAGQRDIGVTAGPTIDTLIRERVVECHGLRYVLTGLGEELHTRWSREQALAELPGVTVKHARQEQVCSNTDPTTGYIITHHYADGRVQQRGVISGAGALAWIERLRNNAAPGDTIAVQDIPNPHHRPDCPGPIHVGVAYAVMDSRRLCMPCAEAEVVG